jgi:hypothetical protein
MGVEESCPADPPRPAPIHPTISEIQSTIPDSDGVFGTQLFADRAAVGDWCERSRLTFPNSRMTIDNLGNRLFIGQRRQVCGEARQFMPLPSDLSEVVSYGREAKALEATKVIDSSDVEPVDQRRCESELQDIYGRKLPLVEAEIKRLQMILENRKKSRVQRVGDPARDPITFGCPRVPPASNLQPMPDALDFIQ